MVKTRNDTVKIELMVMGLHVCVFIFTDPGRIVSLKLALAGPAS